MIKIKHSLLAIILLFASSAFGNIGFEFDLGYSSPNKGLVGARVSPMPLSFGLIWGSFSNFADFGLAYSYHFSGSTGFYIFQSHHYLNSKVGNIWEFDTGGGGQYIWKKKFLFYAELGIPFYIGGHRIYRYYKEGVPYNRLDNGDVAFVSFRTGFGVGYWFEL